MDLHSTLPAGGVRHCQQIPPVAVGVRLQAASESALSL